MNELKKDLNASFAWLASRFNAQTRYDPQLPSISKFETREDLLIIDAVDADLACKGEDGYYVDDPTWRRICRRYPQNCLPKLT